MIAPDTLLQNRYLVQKQIGKGGMGLVYMATDQRFGSTVALKEIFLDAPHLRKAFEREARLLNHLRHAALPRVSDHFTEDDGGQFLVMEFIPGVDLAEMLKGKKVPFPVATVLEWADQLLDALEYLHTHEPSIIHRDIKPQNLKLTSRGHIVLLDFGLAKGTPANNAATATANASVFGYSFNYAPLEQMQGAGTDPRSDLYSLGATLYHLLTNVTPPDALTRATAVLNGEPDPLRPADKVQAQVSGPVARVLESAMAQSAAKRPQTAAEMREALREATRQASAIAPSLFVQPIAGLGAAEQNPQPGGARVTKPLTSYQLNSNSSHPHDAPTVVQPPFMTSDSQPLSTYKRERESVTTKIRMSQPPAPERSASGRMIGILTSVVLLAIAAAAVYAFTRQPATTTPSVQTVPQGDSTTTGDNVVRETQSSGMPPGVSSAPASSREAAYPSNNSPQNNPAAYSSNSQAETPNNSAPAVQPNSRDASAQPESNPSTALTPEAERAEKADEIRRERRLREEEDIRRQKEEADRQRAREFELQRDREMNRRAGPPPPPPGGGFPPPRRGGPPPF
jgi:serine/threonine protein kinase